jgi:hypothetical protein
MRSMVEGEFRKRWARVVGARPRALGPGRSPSTACGGPPPPNG